MSHLPLDARAILQHLNELGYRNISAEQLREFLKDLRKLIKYEERLATNSKEDHLSSLHKRDTVSSRAKLGNRDKDKDKENVPQSSKDNDKRQLPVAANNERVPSGAGSGSSATKLDLAALFRDKLMIDASKEPLKQAGNCVRRSRSKTRKSSKDTAGRASSAESTSNQDKRSSRRSKSRKSRPRSTSRGSTLVRGQTKRKLKHPQKDPVALYQYYQNEWAHFRGQIPGENSHTNVRCAIRNKLLDPK